MTDMRKWCSRHERNWAYRELVVCPRGGLHECGCLHPCGAAAVRRDATVNDAIRSMHRKLWGLAQDEDHDEWEYDDRVLMGACVRLSWREPDRSTPRYIRQAKSFQQFVGELDLEDGLPHVKALAYDRWTGAVDEFY